jgi:hypothetical protein
VPIPNQKSGFHWPWSNPGMRGEGGH